MYISEIPSNTEMVIRAKSNSRETCFTTISIDVNEKILNALENKIHSKFIIVKPIVVDDKLVNFGVKTIDFDIEASVDQKCYIWKKALIHTIDIPSIGKSYIIVSNQNVNFINRRNNFRVSVGIRGMATIGKERVSVTIKDLSNTGVGLIIEKDTSYKEGMFLKLSFEDTKRKKSFSIDCTVVRIGEEGDRYFLLGCVINSIRPDPSYYISLLQREMLHRK